MPLARYKIGQYDPGGEVHTRRLQLFQWGIYAILLYGLLFEAWLIVQPDGHGLGALVERWADPLCPLIVLAAGAFLVGRWLLGRETRPPFAQRAASILLGLGVLASSAGECIWTYFGQMSHRSPVPSWADAVYLIAYPLLLLGILLLPRRGVSPVSRARVVVDGLLLMSAVATLSWYFVLGPTLQQGHQPFSTKLVGAAYPVSDLVLVCCLLLLGFRKQDVALRQAAKGLAVGLGLIVIADSVLAYQTLHGHHITESPLNPIWTVGYMLIALTASMTWLPVSLESTESRSLEDVVRRPSLWQTLTPYVLVPAVVTLGVYAWRSPGDHALELGVYSGAALLIVLMFLHQVLVILENNHLYDRLAEVYADALRQSKEEYHDLFENANDLVFTLDTEGKFIALNQATERTIGYTREEARDLHFTQVISPGCLEAASELLHQEPGEREQSRYEIKIVAKDGQEALLEVCAQTIYQEGRVIGVQSIARDITERKRAAAMLEHQAVHDALTDLPNRSLLHDRIQQTILAARRHNHRLALLLMDLNRFKEINDTFGHHHGDLVLQEVARRLPHTLRESDTVARLGGDEFAVLLPQTDETGATVTAEKVAQSLAEPFTIEDNSFDIGASIGIAVYPVHGEDAESLMRRADVAMYAAKRNKTDHVVYSPEQDDNSPGRLQLIADLRRAIEYDELILHYQPKVDVATGDITSVEALVRWQHPQRGMVPPDQFIPLAEHSGLIKPLTLWVLSAALRQCRAWHEVGIELRIAVNLSMENLRDPHLVHTITDLLTAWHVPPSSLQIEVTESTVMADPGGSIDILTRLHAMGVMIALDDFGTGYSSLAYLKQLPAHEIKIDRSFITDLGSNADDASIVRTINDLGHSLGLEIVAEGVEDRKTLEMLARMGCDVAQGYYLSYPTTAEEITARLEGNESQLAG